RIDGRKPEVIALDFLSGYGVSNVNAVLCVRRKGVIRYPIAWFGEWSDTYFGDEIFLPIRMHPDEGVDISEVGLRIQFDQWRIAMTGRADTGKKSKRNQRRADD